MVAFDLAVWKIYGNDSNDKFVDTGKIMCLRPMTPKHMID